VHVADGSALVKFVDPEQLMRIRQEKKAAADAKAAKKAAAIEAEQAKRLQRLEKGRTPPSAMFKPPHVQEGTYGSWDGAGIPLTDGEGKPLSKNAAKKVQKEHANQQKLHEEYLQWQASKGD
jgi:cysteinyl-tRNA synthetase